MKKVLILTAVMLLMAGQAMALSVVNSKHNLSSAAATQSGAGAIYNTVEDEVCIFCHTPHAGDTTQQFAPLWNRSMTGIGVANYYNSTSLSNASRPSAVSGNISNTDALLCLSCHDGGTLAGGLVNPSENGQPAAGDFNGGVSAIPAASFTNIGANNGTGAARGSSDLRDDHPIAMDYAQAVTDTGGAGVNLFDTAATTALLRNGDVWCSSCHDVHDNANAPFLRMSNANSALCVTCHNK